MKHRMSLMRAAITPTSCGRSSAVCTVTNLFEPKTHGQDSRPRMYLLRAAITITLCEHSLHTGCYGEQ